MKKLLLLPSLIIGLGLSLLTGCTSQGESHPERVVTKFLNYDETVLYVNTIPYGNDAVYQGSTPQRESSASLVYTFTGWDKPLENILVDTTFYAQYSSETRKYEVKFVDYDDTLLETQSLDYGATPVYGGETPTRDADAQYTYAFDKWSPEIAQVSGDATYKATYSTTVNSYTVTWVVDGTETKETYEYGETPSFKGSTDKSATAQYSYDFNGWLPEVSAVTGDITYTAQYNSSVNHYDISWNVNGEVITESYAYGETPSFKGSTDKAPDAEFTYTFSGWSPEVVQVTEAATYTAQYETTKNTYTITWNVNGNETTEVYEYGETPSFKGNTYKEKDAQYTYTFSYWDPAISTVKEDVTYTAKYSTEINTYSITWQNYDGTVLKVDTLEYGSTPVYNGSIPSREADAQYSYEFSGWSPEVSNVTGNATYVAQYAKNLNSYTITWDVEGVKTTETYNYGETPSYKNGTPTKQGDSQYSYAFTGWSPNVAKVTGNATYVAQFSSTVKKYTITWQNYDGTVLYTEDVAYGSVPSYSGSTPTKPKTAQYTYTFSGWSPTVEAVTGKKTYTAQFDSTVNKYTITWQNYDGTVLETDSTDYGTTPTYDGNTPTRGKDAQYTYLFSGWSPSVVKVSGDATYVAQYSTTVNKYTITWVVNGVETYSTFDYGDTPYFNGNTEKDPDAQYTYTFSGWSPELETVTGNATYTAQYSTTLNKYTITWKNDDDSILKTEQYEYGATPSYGNTVPTSADDYGYMTTWKGWSPEIQPVTGDATYTAQYYKTARTFAISVNVPRNGGAASWGEVGIFYEEFTYGSTVPVSYIISKLPEYFTDFGMDSLNHWVYHKLVGLYSEGYMPFEYKDGDEIEVYSNVTINATYITSECGRYPTSQINDGLRLDSIPCDFWWEPQNTFIIPGKLNPNEVDYGGGSTITEIGDYAFSYSGSESLTIKVAEGVKRIGYSSISNAQIVSLKLPSTLTSIGQYAFAACSQLTDLVFVGTKEQWNSISKGSGWNENVPATVVHCSDGNITL